MSVRQAHLRLVLTSIVLAALLGAGCTAELVFGPPGPGDAQAVAVAPIDGTGSATLSPAGDVTVATVDTYAVTYQAGPGGIGGGGSVRFTVPGLWTPPSPLPHAMGHVTVASSVEDVMLDVQVDNIEPDPAETHVDAMADLVTVELAAGVLAEGDTLTLVYGDTDGGGAGARAPFVSLSGVTFGVETDAQGDGTFAPLALSPELDVVPGPPAALRVVATRTLITAGDDVELDVHVEDQFGNKTTGFSGSLDLAVAAESTAPASVAPTLALQAADDGAETLAAVTDGGFLWFDVSDPTGALTGDTSNPVMVREPPDPVLAPPTTYDPPSTYHDFWGALHEHSDISGNAPKSADDTYEFMIDDANLKFGALTDYNNTTSDVQWAALKDSANDYHCVPPTNPATCFDGKHFITFLASERNAAYGEGGHMNLYFFQKDGTDIEYKTTGDQSIPLYRHSDPSGDYDDPCDLWEAYHAEKANITGFDFFSIPHHPAADDGVPPRHALPYCPQECTDVGQTPRLYQPVIEAYSRHGNSMRSASSSGALAFPEEDPISCEEENGNHTVEAALDPNIYTSCLHRLGIIGSGDSHDGRPGATFQRVDAFDPCPGTPRTGGGSWDFDWYRSPRKGLICAYAQGASANAAFRRSKIMGALRDRTVYATTGARIGLWFEIEVNDGPDVIYMGGEHTDDNDSYEAHIQGAYDGETIEYYRLMWYDPDDNSWSACAEVGPLTAYGFDAAIDLQNCINTGTNIYYVEIEQKLAVEDKFMVHDENKYIDFEIDGVDYSADLNDGTGIKVYTASALATEIGSAMNAAYAPGGDPFSASYSSNKFTITNDDEDAFELLWLTGDNGPSGTDKSAARLLGFDDTSDTSSLDSHPADWEIHSDGWSEQEMAWSSPIWIDY